MIPPFGEEKAEVTSASQSKKSDSEEDGLPGGIKMKKKGSPGQTSSDGIILVTGKEVSGETKVKIRCRRNENEKPCSLLSNQSDDNGGRSWTFHQFHCKYASLRSFHPCCPASSMMGESEYALLSKKRKFSLM